MTRRDFMGAALGGLCAGMLARAGLAAGAPRRPNLLLFLVDDMGWQDTSVPFWTEATPFNRHYRTPNMERLARTGIRFTNAHAHPVCSPTRTSLMTGQNPARHHVTNWTLFPDEDPSAARGRTASPKGWRMGGLQPSDTTLPALLRRAGYHTIHCGKAHWGAWHTEGSDPRNLGFDVNIAGHSTGAPGSYQGEDCFTRKEDKDRTDPWKVPGLDQYCGTETHLTDALTEEAKKALDHAATTGKPFFLYMAHYAVHTPIQPHERFMGSYRNRNYDGTEIDIPPEEEKYASMVEGMDASLGALLDHLEKLGEAENTLVVFTSDNGGLSAVARGTTPRGTGRDTHNWPLKAGKGSAYEGGTRVPFIAAWAKPSADNPVQRELPIRADSVSGQAIISEDLFPTLLALAGGANPEGHTVDGRDLRPCLAGETPDPERPLVFHYPHMWGPEGLGYEPHSALHTGDWRLAYFYNPRRWELHNLANDIGEEHDLSGEQPEKLLALAAQLRDALVRMGAQWPVERATGAEEPPVMPPNPKG